MLIGLTGKAGSGKDTAADYLVANYGFTKISFADTLKKMLTAAGFPEPTNREDKEKIIPGFDFTWREAAQKLGTEWGRDLDPNIWIKITGNSLNSNKRYIISDVRFENEAALVREEGVLVNIKGRQTAMQGNTASHRSERGIQWDDRDIIINNSKSIEDLYKDINAIMLRLNINPHRKLGAW